MEKISFREGDLKPDTAFFPAGNMEGFSLLETLIAIVIFSIGLMAVSSISIGTVGTNKLSKHQMEAGVLAQSQLEILRNQGFKLGPDGILGTQDDVVAQILQNPNATNDTVTDPALMFQSPDHAYALNADGSESTTIVDSPNLTPQPGQLRRVWVIRDNVPAPGMKSISVVVGWMEGSAPVYVVVSSAIQGQ